MQLSIIIVFNILFGLASGIITSRVFTIRDWNKPGWFYTITELDVRMVFSVTISSTLTGLFMYMILPEDPSWWWLKGLVFGSMIPAISMFLLKLDMHYNALKPNPKQPITLVIRLKFIIALYNSFEVEIYFFLALLASLFGWATSLVPVLGIGWGYLLYNYVIPLSR